MNITVTYRTGENQEHILQIDPRQEIGSGLRVLMETGKVDKVKMPDFFRSASLAIIVSAYCTFEEAGIYSGDVLAPINNA